MDSFVGFVTRSDTINRRQGWMAPAHEQEAGRPMSEGRSRGADRSGEARRPILNTHVHLPPNFSAFDTVEDAVTSAAREGVRVLGASNFHDLSVYARFESIAVRAGILPLFGMEFTCVVDALQQGGTRVNDPANPGRMYLCAKGIGRYATPGPEALRLMAAARAVDEDRMRRMVARLRAWFAAAGLETSLTDALIAEDVAERAGVPRATVVLQERHVAMAFQEALFRQADAGRRGDLLTRAFGGPPAASVEDPIAIQGEIRSRLMKAGRPAFESESPVSFEHALRLTLELEGIPCYPTLADGASPVCPWEEPPAGLAERLLARGIPAAELIPGRNRPEVVDAYVAAFRDAGIVVMAGTEHNTRQRIPLEPRCVDGSLPSPTARAAFWEATCVVAAHQHLRTSGRPGYVDGQGRLNPGFPDGEARIRWFAELGAELIGAAPLAVAR